MGPCKGCNGMGSTLNPCKTCGAGIGPPVPASPVIEKAVPEEKETHPYPRQLRGHR
jgi:hypothetical protein